MKKTIFVVDDSISNLSVAEEALEKNYRIITLTSAQKMFALLESVIPDLILLDVAMPEVSGFDALKRLKSSPEYSKIPVMFLTALQDSYNEAYGFELGAVDFITKPFSQVILLRRVKNHLDIDALVRERTEELEKAMATSEAKSLFLSTMSHEMRTPLNAIIGMTAIGKKADDIEGKNHALNKIGDASSHLLGVINDVLDMAKIEANKLELSHVEYNFDRMLQKVITVVNFRIEEKNQTLTVNIDGKIPRFVTGDDQRLSQVITNLLSNAAKFTPQGGRIHLDASLIGEEDGICELQIEITDSGIGISKENQENLFSSFTQAETGISREYGGTGLGLAISKSIVEMMKGKIWVESVLNKGAKFTFTVKVERSDKSSRSLLTPGLNWENVRILVADDSPIIRKHFEELFNQLKIKADMVADGLEACCLIEEKGGYDIYFVGWQMPGMDGIELTRAIKSRKDDRPSAVIMITAADREQIKARAANAGVDKYLLKPIFASSIIDVLNECMGVFATCRAQSENSEVQKGGLTGKKMLLAEDIEINREILIEFLKDTGLLIHCADNGAEALKMIEAAPDTYDIVFMDVQMPKMNGYEATRRIRELPAIKERKNPLPIIALTANVFREDIESCLKSGMDAHLGKPLDIDKVLDTLCKYLI